MTTPDRAAPATATDGQRDGRAYREGMHKRLLLLGLLQHGPVHGYELARIVRAHGELYQDLKKANIYYLLDRLAQERFVKVRAQPGSMGRRGERLIYTLTRRGRTEFHRLLECVLATFEPSHTGVDVAVIFLSQLDEEQALGLLERRRLAVEQRRDEMATELSKVTQVGTLNRVAADHLLALVDAELAWLERSLSTLRNEEWHPDSQATHDESTSTT